MSVDASTSPTIVEMDRRRSNGGASLRAGEELLASLWISLTSVGLSILLLFTYATFSTVVFSYYGYDWKPTWLTVLVGVLLVSVVALFLPTYVNRPGDIAVYILFLLAYVPAIVIPPAFLHMPIGKVLAFQITLSICMLMVIGSNLVPRVRIDLGLFTHQWYLLSLIALFILLMVPVVYYLGIPNRIPTFGEVYEVRYASRASMESAPGFVAYFWSWLAKVINPYLLAYGLVQRNKVAIFLGVGGTLYLYAMTGAKLLVFSMAMVIGVMLALRLLGRAMVLIMPVTLGLVVVAAKLLDTVLFTTSFTSLLVNRPMVLPGILSGYYFEFFSTHPKGNWGYTFLSSFYEYPYEATPSFLIGEAYFDSATNQANAHMWVDGFANFGYSGMVFVSVLAGILIWTLNSVSIGRSELVVASMTFVVIYSLASTSLFTSLLTNGILVTLVLILVSPINGQTGRSANSQSWLSS